jgi:tetratricopeptide (TPR) repeat protein
MDALVSLVHDVLEARIALPDVEGKLTTILDALSDPSADAALQANLIGFVHELVQDYLIRDKLPLRAEALARIAWRTARAAGITRATLLGLFATYLLLQLDAHQEALGLVELIEADARSNDDPLLRAATVLRVQCLSALQRFKDAHRLACEYEKLSPGHRADILEVIMLIAAADAAASAGDAGLALERARRAVAVFESAPATADKDDLMTMMFPAPLAPQIYMTLGNALRRAHDHLGAIDAYQRGRAKALDDKQAVGAAWCLSEIAITWEQLSEFQRAAELLEQAASEAEQAGDLRAAARWRHQHVPGDDDGVVDLKGVNGLAAIGEMLRTKGPSDEIEQQLKVIIKAERGTGTTIEPWRVISLRMSTMSLAARALRLRPSARPSRARTSFRRSGSPCPSGVTMPNCCSSRVCGSPRTSCATASSRTPTGC